MILGVPIAATLLRKALFHSCCSWTEGILSFIIFSLIFLIIFLAILGFLIPGLVPCFSISPWCVCVPLFGQGQFAVEISRILITTRGDFLFCSPKDELFHFVGRFAALLHHWISQLRCRWGEFHLPPFRCSLCNKASRVEMKKTLSCEMNEHRR